MARKLGLYALKAGADRHQGLVAEVQALLALLGVSPGETPSEEPGQEPAPIPSPGLPPTGERIVTEFGSPPEDLDRAIRQYWPATEWKNAARMAHEESGWRNDAERNTLARAGGRCNVPIGTLPDGTPIVSEQSVGYFQINVCAHKHDRAYWIDTDNNVSYAAQLYREGGWGAWRVSARKLGLR